MIHHWKGLEFLITDSEYLCDLAVSAETIPPETCNPQICRVSRTFDNSNILYTFEKVLHRRIQINLFQDYWPKIVKYRTRKRPEFTPKTIKQILKKGKILDKSDIYNYVST